MKLLQLIVDNYRNLVSVDLHLSEGLNVFHGSNAQGKTNLLEAAHYLLLQRSFRGARATEMICFGADHAHLRGRVVVDGLESQVDVFIDSDGRRTTVDGKALRAISGGLTRGLAAVVFIPEDLQIPRGSPNERRRFLDHAVSTVWPDYAVLVRDYSKTLRSRNRLLRERSTKLTTLLDVYDGQLAAFGAKIMLTRERFLRSFMPTFDHVFSQIVGESSHAALRYLPTSSLAESLEATAIDLHELSASYARELVTRRRQDIERRQTSLGPHADDLAFLVDHRLARHFASQGQVRALVLAFRIAQILDTRERLGHAPLLLLDDVSSELDPDKNRYLFNFIDELSCQVMLTTTRPDLVPHQKNRCDFNVLNGSIT